jgi:HK97 family phage major capsid protein
MKTKIKLIQEYQDQPIGFECLVEKAGAHQLVEKGIAEIMVDDIELEKEADVRQAEMLALVKAEIDKGLKEGIEFHEKVEVKEKPIYQPNMFGMGNFFKDVKEAICTGSPSESLKKLDNFVREKAPSGNNTLINTEGGYLVPLEFSTMLMDQVQGEAVLAPRTFNIPINSRITLPYIRDDDKSASWAGGVAVTWGQEGATLTSSKAEVNQVELKLKKVHALTYATDELMDDSAVAMGTVLSKLAGIALAKEFDETIINGSGAGRPLGILNAPATVSVAKESGQTATTINTSNILNMWKRQANPGNAVWLINRDALDQIYKLNLAVGTAGGSNVFMFNVAERQSETILGAPIIWTEHCQTLGTEGDIICADLSAYLTATKAGGPQIKSASSIHVKFLTDEVAFRFTMRVDGQPWWPAAQTPKHGSNTISPFVSLAVRA